MTRQLHHVGRKRVLQYLAALVLLGLAGFLWQSQRVPPRIDPVSQHQPGVQATSLIARLRDQPLGLGTNETQVKDPAIGRMPASLVRIESAPNQVSASLELLLTRTCFAIHRMDVPLLDAGTEATLADRYRAAESITAKVAILRVLAFGGSARSLPIMTNAYLSEFRGRQVTRDEHAMLLDIPISLGILAHREPSAAQFLVEAAVPGGIREGSLWRCSEVPINPRIARSRCIQGLGFSGRAEAQSFLEQFRLHPEDVLQADLEDDCIRDAVCDLWVIGRHGWDKAMDEVLLHDLGRSMQEYRSWKVSAEGRPWAVEWRKKIQDLRAAQSRQ